MILQILRAKRAVRQHVCSLRGTDDHDSVASKRNRVERMIRKRRTNHSQIDLLIFQIFQQRIGVGVEHLKRDIRIQMMKFRDTVHQLLTLAGRNNPDAHAPLPSGTEVTHVLI